MNHTLLLPCVQYRNENVISRFTDLFDIPQLEAEDIFEETKKFLSICLRPGVFIPDELLILDEMWHNFILFTKVYEDFCQNYFGKYLHHTPATKTEKEFHRQNMLKDLQKTRQEFDSKLSGLIAIVYDHLGNETVVKWFVEYPKKYSKESIKALRKN